MTDHGDLDNRLAGAKFWLISSPVPGRHGAPPRDLPYLATALYALVTVPSHEVRTLAADANWRLYVNPDWALNASAPQIAAELVHQVWHLLHDHANRARSSLVGLRESKVWQKATDAALSSIVSADGLDLPEFPTPYLLKLPTELSAEEYYALLAKQPAGAESHDDRDTNDELSACGSACDGIPRPYDLPVDVEDVASVSPTEAARLRTKVAIDFTEYTMSRGDTPGDALRWAKEILEPKIDWRPLLSSAVRRAMAWTNGHTEYTYARRSRRQSGTPNVVLPGMRRPVPSVAVVVDTSGSVDDGLLGQALGEVDGALSGLGVAGASVSVLACDASVQAVSKVRSARDTLLAGGGGTDLRAGIAAAAVQRPRPEIVIVLTDGFTPWPDQPPPGAAVIAAILSREGYPSPPTPQWARRVECAL